VRGCGAALAPLVEGVRQESFQELGRTLLALRAVYLGTEDRELRQKCRRLVIEAKDHGRWALRREAQRPCRASEERDVRQAQKEEMIQWMIIWLENPEIFETWSQLRWKHITESQLFQLE
jgi:hypothetical protein